MTTSNENSRWPYNGDGSTTSFPYDNKIFAASDLKVYVGGVLKTLTTDYSVTGVGLSGGGNVVFLAAPAAGTGNVIIEREVPAVQPIDLVDEGNFPADAVEAGLDRATIAAQQNAKKIGRALRQPSTDAADIGILPDKGTRAGKTLGFDGTSGDPIAVAAGVSTAIVSAFGQTLIDDADAATARATLGVLSAGTKATGTSTGQVPLAENVIGKQTLGFVAGSFTARFTNGAAKGTVEHGTNKIMVDTLDYDQSTQEYAQLWTPMPKGANESAGLSARAIWAASAGSGGVTWSFRALALSDGDDIDTAFGTAILVSDTLTATNKMQRTSESSTITPGGSWTEGDWLVIEVSRAVADAGDTLTADAKLVGIELYYTENAAVDS